VNPPRFLEDIALLLARLQQAPGQVHVRVWQELSPWLRSLVSTASLKWVERLGASEQCHVVTIDAGTGHRCHGAAIAHCVGCKKPTCLTHAFVDGSGEAVCFACVTELIAHKGVAGPAHGSNGARPPTPSNPKDVAWARRLFKVKASASWSDVRAAHRKLSARWHPDKVQDATGKAKAEEKFKELGRAFEILKKEYGQ
jgi:hypothetical protein